MKIGYYTIDDVRLGYDPKGVSGWRLSRFLRLRDALEHYRELPASGVKVLGLTDGLHELELVRCVFLFHHDAAGESVLASDYRAFPLWRSVKEAGEAARACIKELLLRYMLTPDAAVPIPTSDKLPEALRDKYLWLSHDRRPDSAIRLVYVAGTGWVPPQKREHQPGTYPLVLSYRADGITEQGAYIPLEVKPWEYELLARRTLERLAHQKTEV